MPQYQVPQFIDIEDRVFGPLTIRQTIYIAIAIAGNMIVYKFFKMWVVLLVGLPIAMFMLAMAFYKYNGIPFPKVLRAMMRYTLSKKLYLWKKRAAESSVLPEISMTLPQVGPATKEETPLERRFTEYQKKKSLQDLSWSIDVQHIEKPHG